MPFAYEPQMNSKKNPKFATRLSYKEKSWLAGAINHFLRHSYGNELSGQSFKCTNCGAELPQGNGNIACEQCNETHVIKSASLRTQHELGSRFTKYGRGPRRSLMYSSTSGHRQFRRTNYLATLQFALTLTTTRPWHLAIDLKLITRSHTS